MKGKPIIGYPKNSFIFYEHICARLQLPYSSHLSRASNYLVKVEVCTISLVLHLHAFKAFFLIRTFSQSHSRRVVTRHAGMV